MIQCRGISVINADIGPIGQIIWIPSSLVEMENVVNLRTARKRRGRRQQAAQAAENRAAYGQSKAERRQREGQELKASRDLDAHRIANGEEQ